MNDCVVYSKYFCQKLPHSPSFSEIMFVYYWINDVNLGKIFPAFSRFFPKKFPAISGKIISREISGNSRELESLVATCTVGDLYNFFYRLASRQQYV